MSISGISVPFQGTQTGGLSISSDDEYIRQLIMIALSDCSSDNPFQDIGLGEGHVFQPNTSRTKGQILVRVKKVFDDFELRKLARLNGRPKWLSAVDGEAKLLISYYNLETDKPDELTI